jgi:hypothetical protein
VCIDQSNTKERAHQVNFMGDIYANAREVLISLSAEQDLPGGLGWLNMFSPTDPDFSSDELAGDDCCVHNGGTVMRSNQSASQVRDFHLGWDAFIATVLRSQWWSRVWIRQEFFLSVQAYFMASFEFVQWEHLAPAIDRCSEAVHSSRKQTLEPLETGGVGACADLHVHGDEVREQRFVIHDTYLDIPVAEPCAKNPRQLAFQYADFQSPCGRLNCFGCAIRNNKPVFREDAKRVERLLTAKTKRSARDEGILHTLCDVHLCEASDPRDLIYACIALTDQHYGIQPDYTNGITLEDVLTDLASKVILQDGNLDILRLALSTHKGNACHGVPSWVPDWRHGPDVRGYHVPTGEQLGVPDIGTVVQVVERGSHGRILRARGVFRESITMIKRLGRRDGAYHAFTTSEKNEVHTAGDVRLGDECWSLYGAKDFYVFRRKGQYHELVGKVSGPRLQAECPPRCDLCSADHGNFPWWSDECSVGVKSCPHIERECSCMSKHQQGTSPHCPVCKFYHPVSTLAEIDNSVMNTIEIC